VHLFFGQRRQGFSDRVLGSLEAYAEDTQHRLGRFLLEVKDRAGEIVPTADAENSRRDPIPYRRALRAKLVVNLDRLAAADTNRVVVFDSWVLQ
jgi:hypothetical protein